jgi:hypothetical protein
LAVSDEGDNRLAASADFSVTVDDVIALDIARALDLGEVHLVRSTGAPDVTADKVDGP